VLREGRSIPLPHLCAEALREHRDRQEQERSNAHHWTDSGFVFATPIGTPVDPRNFSRQFAAWCDRAGVPVVRLHDLRHTCVSLLLSLGVPPRVVMEILGHTQLATTMDIYSHVMPGMQREALGQMERLLAAGD
jgi:integrase